MKLNEFETEEEAELSIQNSIRENLEKNRELLTQNGQQDLTEVSREDAFLMGLTIPAVAIGGLVVAAGITGNPALILAYYGIQGFFALGFSGIVFMGVSAVTGMIASFFATGRRRDLYKKIDKKAEDIIRLVKSGKREVASITDEDVKQDVIADINDRIGEEIYRLNSYVDELEDLLTRQYANGDAGIFRASYREWLARKVEQGHLRNLDEIVKLVHKEAEKMFSKEKEEDMLSRWNS